MDALKPGSTSTQKKSSLANKLQIECRLIRQQLEETEKKLKALKQEDVKRTESQLFMNQLWDKLDAELLHLAARAGFQPAEHEPGDAAVAVVATTAQAIPDPYLNLLLDAEDDPASFKAVKKAHGALQQGLSDEQLALQARSQATETALAHVLEVVQQQTRYSSSLAAQIASSGAEAALKQENQRLEGELTRLQQKTDCKHAIDLSASQLLKHTQGQLQTAEGQRKKAEDDLANKETLYDVARRKIMQLQEQVKNAEAEAAAAKAAIAAAVPTNPTQAQAAGPSGAMAAPSASTTAAPAPNPAAPVAPDIQEQLADLQRLCDSRAAELETERLEHIKTKQNLQGRATRLESEVAAWRQQRDKAVADRDAMVNTMTDYNTLKEDNKLLKVQLDTQLKRVEAMTMHHADLTEQANCAKLELEAYKTNESHKSTLDGLTAIINALQKQLDLKDAELRKYKVAGETVDSSQKQLAAALAKAEAAGAQVTLLQQRLRDKTATMVEGARREAKLKELLTDAQVFVDVLLTCNTAPPDVTELRKSKRKLERRVAELEQAQQTDELQLKLADATAAEHELRAALDEATAAADGLRGEVTGLKQKVVAFEELATKARKDVTFGENEISSIGKDYEQATQDNLQFVANLAKRDTTINDLNEAKLLVQQELAELQQQHKEVQMQLAGLQAEHSALQGRQAAVEGDLIKAQAEVAQAIEAVRVSEGRCIDIHTELEKQSQEFKRYEELYGDERDACSSARERATEAAVLVEREKVQRQKLEEDNQVLKKQVERLRQGADKDERYQELLKDYDDLLLLTKCQSCKEKPLKVAIKACGHAFCRPCLGKYQDGRNRICPTCKNKYGGTDKDIINLYLDF